MISILRKFFRSGLLIAAWVFGLSGVAYAKTAQTITFNALANQTYGVAPFTVSATASSGLTVTFSSATTTVCTVSGTTVTVIAAGTCTINANQAGNGTYSAAPQVQRSFTVSKANQTITFGSLPNRTDAAQPFTVSATASSSLTVTFSSLTTSTCTVSGTTVTVVADGTCTIAADQAGNGNYNAASEVTQSFTIGPFCAAPPNIPNGVTVTCVCDTFKRTTLNPSPMFGGTSWAANYSDTTGVAPYINQTTGLLRLTENTNYNAKAATAPGIFPAAGNYISVEFNHYAYNGSGADGVGVILSDSKISAVPGGYGGSQGYAPESNPGFAGGWLGVALDEYGNYSNPTEGRTGGPGAEAEEVGMRGPGSGTNGYNWITGTGTLTPGLSGIDNHTATSPSYGYMYQVIVDARNETTGTINVAVNRDTTTLDGNNYAQLIAPFNVYSAAQTALTNGWITTLVPNYWQLSFTSSTGGSTNIHEIGNVRVCAQTVYPPSGGTASGFSAIDSWYPTSTNSVPAIGNFQTGHIFMKVLGIPFKLWVGALTSNGGSVQYGYSASQTKYVLLNLVNNAGGAACGLDGARTCNSTCTGQTPVTGGSQILAYSTSTSGAVQSSAITLNTAYSDLVAVMKECSNSTCTSFTSTPAACSVDSFSVRPTTVSVAPSATNATASGAVAGAAGAPFAMTATVTGVTGQPSGYNGTLRLLSSGMTANIDTSSEANPWTPNLGTLTAVGNSTVSFPAATPDSPSAGIATSIGSFAYSEVGSFSLPAYAVIDGVNTLIDCPTSDTLCDPIRQTLTWTGVDSVSSKGDCNANSYSNTIDSSGKYGCNFGYGTAMSNIGRFTPSYYLLLSTPGSAPVITPRSDISSCSALTPFSYMGEPFGIAFSLQAMSATGSVTKNYQGNYVKFNSMSSTAPWTAVANSSTGTMGLAMEASNYGSNACSVFFSSGGVTSYSCPSGTTPASTTNLVGGVATPRVAVSTTPALPSMLWGSTASSGAQGNPGVGLFTANVELLRTSAGPDGPFKTLGVGIDAIDTDGIATTGLNLATNNGPLSPTADRVSLGTTATKFGMLKIQNAFGSALVPLPVPVQVQYWNGSMFITNTSQSGANPTYDSCTPISGASMQLTFQGSLAACNTYVPTTTTVNDGSGLIILPAPNGHQTGTMTMTDLLASPSSGVACNGSNTSSAASYVNEPYLQGNWLSTSPTNYSVNPNARATFGVYSGSPAVIYTRESY